MEESLLQAIKNDDIKAFNALVKEARCGAYRLGRFPVLSLLYLYKARKVLSAYEKEFLKITSFEKLREPVEVSKKFSSKAGKCLRLYLDEVVSPLEMLLILDKTKRLKRVYSETKPSAAVKERLKLIYSIKYSLTVKFDGDDIIIDRRPLSYREKKNIATACLISFLALTVTVGVPVTTVSLMPKPVEGEVTKFSQIDFGSQKEYTLKRNVVVPDNFRVDKTNCKIIGGGNKLIFGNGASFGEFNGKMSDLTIESSGNAIFSSVSENATIDNVTLNVKASVSSTQSTAFVAETNYGMLDGITVNVSGAVNALSPSDETSSELFFGGIVQNNNYKLNYVTETVYRGVIKNCTVNYSQFTLKGEIGANASFGGVAGINSGYLQDCTVTGQIAADTFDIAGVCSVNSGVLSGNINEADITQTSADVSWNPIVCGIVLSNAYAVQNCENRGKISAFSTCGEFEEQEEYESTVSAAGIAYLNRSSTTTPYIRNCVNSGVVECGAEYRNAYSAGLCLSSSGTIESCENRGTVTASTNNDYSANVGGIATLSYGDIYKSINEGAVSATCNGTACAGGIAARSWSQSLYCLSSGDVTVKAKNVYAGGISGVSEVASSFIYVYCGTADYCISESKIAVTSNSEAAVYAGGITGYVSEAGFNSGGEIVYFGGGVTNSYFTGECGAEISYFGNIVGVCGANIYESNSYVTSGNTEYHNFTDNYYLNNSSDAIGATISDDGEFASAGNKGAEPSTTDDIKNYDGYKQILNALEK